MDVARISAVSPRQIDWRSLTARQIIKYEQQGVEVPSMYLQWAIDFRATIDLDDETTYEMAQEASSTGENVQNYNTDGGANSNVDLSHSDSSEVAATDMEGEDKTAAQKKREDLQNANVSLRNQALIFTSDSKSATNSAIESAQTLINTETQSVNEIEKLDNYMSELLSKAEATQSELKNEVAKLNNDKGDISSISKINKYQQQLQAYGVSGQNSVSVTESELSQFDSVINAQSSAILNAQDFGAETVNVGNDLLTSIKGAFIFRIADYIAGKQAVMSGNESINQSLTTADAQIQANATNSENKSSASSYKSKITDKTGVLANTVQDYKNKDDDTSQKAANEDKTATNDGTDTTDRLNTNLDEILKRKIRKGENINA